jgi:polyisoprenoid-binding protein YceI
VTAPVIAHGTFETGQGPDGRERAAFELTAEIDRREFGICWQNKMPNGLDAVGGKVKLDVSLQLVKEN